MIIAICAGGPTSEVAFSLQPNKWIGVDGGAYALIEREIIPDAIVGDFDSVSAEQFARMTAAVEHVDIVQSEKDETDTDLALALAVQWQPTEVWLTGVTGGRLDHYEAAIRAMYRMQKTYPAIRFKIINNQNELQFLWPGKHPLKKSHYQYISFFAYEQPMKQVTLRGVKYETTNEEIELGTSRFTSNEILMDASISFVEGICLMVTSLD